jgi:DNA (cytosine-5)-methyltransferase 1
MDNTPIQHRYNTDIIPYAHGSLFSGIGGFDLAAEWMGWTNVFQCEIDPFCQKVLKYHFPNTILHNDIKQTDFTIYRGRIDVLTGGFPCQPFSQAGKRKGTEDDRHLWPEMLRAIREIQPGYIVGENVYGLINWDKGVVFDQVQTNLETEGYEVFPYVLPACGREAPHRRRRVWFVAHSKSLNASRIGGLRNCERTGNKKIGGGLRTELSGNGTEGIIINSVDCGYKAGRKEKTGQDGVQKISRPTMDAGKFNGTDIPWNDTNGYGSIGCKGRMYPSEQKTATGHAGSCDAPGHKCGTWDNFPTQSPICGGNDGIPNRVDRIKSLGNAIVPELAYTIFQVIDNMTISLI